MFGNKCYKRPQSSKCKVSKSTISFANEATKGGLKKKNWRIFNICTLGTKGLMPNCHKELALTLLNLLINWRIFFWLSQVRKRIAMNNQIISYSQLSPELGTCGIFWILKMESNYFIKTHSLYPLSLYSLSYYNKKLFFCTFYKVNSLFLLQSYLKSLPPVELTCYEMEKKYKFYYWKN